MKLFFDINVVLDVLANREPFAEDAARLLSIVDKGQADGLIAAHAVTTLSYLLGRSPGKRKARRALLELLRLVDVVPVGHQTILTALAMDWANFEDAVHSVCAGEGGANYFDHQERSRLRQLVGGASVAV